MRLIDADALSKQLIEDAEHMDDMVAKMFTYAAYNDVNHAPTVDAVPVIRCKDCKYYETDHFENFNGIPLIVAHEICMRWGDGCNTSPDGYCFMAERKE